MEKRFNPKDKRIHNFKSATKQKFKLLKISMKFYYICNKTLENLTKLIEYYGELWKQSFCYLHYEQLENKFSDADARGLFNLEENIVKLIQTGKRQSTMIIKDNLKIGLEASGNGY